MTATIYNVSVSGQHGKPFTIGCYYYKDVASKAANFVNKINEGNVQIYVSRIEAEVIKFGTGYRTKGSNILIETQKELSLGDYNYLRKLKFTPLKLH